MGRLFDVESPVMQALTKASCVFFCGFFFFVTCIPVVTAGAGLCAMYKMMFNIREEKPAGAREFFKTFAAELKRGTVLWILLICGVLMLFFFAAGVISIIPEGILFSVFTVMIMFISLGFMLTFTMAFPLECYFDNKPLVTLKKAFLISLSFRNKSIPAVFLWILPVLLYMISPYYFIRFLPLIIFVVIPAVIYFQSGLMQKIFENFTEEN